MPSNFWNPLKNTVATYKAHKNYITDTPFNFLGNSALQYL